MKMNGREITNTVAVAAQIARSMRQSIQHSHLKEALNASCEFNRYLEAVHGDPQGMGTRASLRLDDFMSSKHSDDESARPASRIQNMNAPTRSMWRGRPSARFKRDQTEDDMEAEERHG